MKRPDGALSLKALLESLSLLLQPCAELSSILFPVTLDAESSPLDWGGEEDLKGLL